MKVYPCCQHCAEDRAEHHGGHDILCVEAVCVEDQKRRAIQCA